MFIEPRTSRPARILSRTFLICAVLLSIGVRCRLATFPLERDEGEFAYAGQLLLDGIPPYKLAYNMKLPGTHIAYAILMRVFGQTPEGVHYGLLLVNLATIVMVYFLTRSLFDRLSAGGATLVYAILSVSPSVYGMSAHATHFVTLFGIAGTIVLWRYLWSPDGLLAFAAGVLLGIAFLMKQQGIFLMVFGGLCVCTRLVYCGPSSRLQTLRDGVIYCIGAATPYLLVCWWLWSAGVWDAFQFWTIDYAAVYTQGGAVRPSLPFMILSIGAAIDRNFSIWLLAGVGLIASFSTREASVAVATLSPETTAARVPDRQSWSCRVVFACGYLIFSSLCVLPGLLFRAHYFVTLLPAIAMFASVGCLSFEVWTDDALFRRWWRNWWNSSPPPLSDMAVPADRMIVPREAELLTFPDSNSDTSQAAAVQSTKTLGLPGAIVLFGLAIGMAIFLQRSDLFFTTPIQLCRELYGSNPFPESSVIADYLKDHTGSPDSVAVLGSEPQLYFLSHRHSCTGYIYMYPLMEKQPFARRMQEEMIREVEEGMPSYIVDVHVARSWVWVNDERRIFDWKRGYLKEHYRPVGLCLMTAGESVFRWEENIERMPPATQEFVAIYRKK